MSFAIQFLLNSQCALHFEPSNQCSLTLNSLHKLRAPEEILDAPLTEKIDVYSLGNVFYSILTGLLVNGEYTTSQAHFRIIHGKTEDIDVKYFESRSQAEYALVKIIQLCWIYDAEERPSVFDIVALLENEVKSFD